MWEPEPLLKFNHIHMRTHWDLATCRHTSAYVFYPSFSSPASLQKTSKNYPDLICILILFRRTLYMPTKMWKKKKAYSNFLLCPDTVLGAHLSWEALHLWADAFLVCALFACVLQTGDSSGSILLTTQCAFLAGDGSADSNSSSSAVRRQRS